MDRHLVADYVSDFATHLKKGYTALFLCLFLFFKGGKQDDDQSDARKNAPVRYFYGNFVQPVQRLIQPVMHERLAGKFVRADA